MANKEAEKVRKIRSRNPCFPSCFGFPRKDSGRGTKKKWQPGYGENGSERKRHWFSGSTFRIRSSGRKTVPVDAAAVDNVTRVDDAGIEQREIVELTPEAVVAVSAQKGAFGQKMNQSDGQTCIPQSRRSSDTLTGGEDDTCQKSAPLHNRQTDQRKAGSRPASVRTSPVRPSTPPGSSPRTRHKSGNTAVISPSLGQKWIQKIDPSSGKSDPMLGMSIMVVTLVIMIVGGRICAIICTSVWFYYMPRLRMAATTTANSGDVVGSRASSSTPDVDSEEYKKKVIMDGLLERNHKNRPNRP